MGYVVARSIRIDPETELMPQMRKSFAAHQFATGLDQAETMISSYPNEDMRAGGYEGLENAKRKMGE